MKGNAALDSRRKKEKGNTIVRVENDRGVSISSTTDWASRERGGERQERARPVPGQINKINRKSREADAAEPSEPSSGEDTKLRRKKAVLKKNKKVGKRGTFIHLVVCAQHLCLTTRGLTGRLNSSSWFSLQPKGRVSHGHWPTDRAQMESSLWEDTANVNAPASACLAVH